MRNLLLFVFLILTITSCTSKIYKLDKYPALRKVDLNNEYILFESNNLKYKDSIIDIVWDISENEFNFRLKNIYVKSKFSFCNS